MRRVNLLCISLSAYFLCGIFWQCLQAQQPQLAPLPIKESLAALKFGVSAISLSPSDERWVVYQLRDVKRVAPSGEDILFTHTGIPISHTACDIWIANTESGESRNLTEGKGSNWAPVWSPNGNYLAFYSDRSGQANLWLWERASGKLRQLSSAIPRPYYFNLPRWTPDSKRVLVKVLPEGITLSTLLAARATGGLHKSEPLGAGGAKVEVYQSAADPKRAESKQPPASIGSMGEIDDTAADLALVDIASGKSERIVRGHIPAGYWMSPNGASIAFLDVKAKADFEGLFDLVVFTQRGKRVVATGIHQSTSGETVSWSPDSEQLRYLSKGEWLIVSGNGGSPRKITEAAYPKLGGISFQPNLWDESGE